MSHRGSAAVCLVFVVIFALYLSKKYRDEAESRRCFNVIVTRATPKFLLGISFSFLLSPSYRNRNRFILINQSPLIGLVIVWFDYMFSTIFFQFNEIEY